MSQKNPSLLKFLTFLSQTVGDYFSPNLHAYYTFLSTAGLQIFIQLPAATLTKLWHIKRDHHNVLKMSTIDRNARWVVALNMA